MGKLTCPACGGQDVPKATRAERKTFPGVGTYDNIRTCRGCGRLFEAPWPGWQVWFCLICGWATLVAGGLLVLVLALTGDVETSVTMVPVMAVSALVLPAALRQRRVFHRKQPPQAPPPGAP